MKNNNKFKLILCLLLSTNFLPLATAADPASNSSVNASPIAEPPFIASEFQKNISKAIDSINQDIDNFLKKEEIQAINYGLHIVNFPINGEEIQLSNAEQQFVADFARIACYPKYESNLTECNSENDANSPNTYGFLRPSNIFETSIDENKEKALAAFTARTMINPLPDSKLNEILQDKSNLTDPVKQQEIAQLIAIQAPITLAKNSFNEIIAKRTKFDKQDQSMMQIIKQESTRRTQKDWIESIQDLPLRHLMLELLEIEAFRTWMDYQKFLQNEKIEALIATLLASQTNSLNKLIYNLDKAAQENKKAAEKASQNIQQSTGDNIDSNVISKGGFNF